MKTIAIIPPIPLPRYERERRRERYSRELPEGYCIDFRQLKGGPPLTDREYELFWSSLYMLLEAEAAEREGADAIVIDCTADSGLTEMRQSVTIPVAGALTASLASIEPGTPFSILALDEHWRRIISARLSGYGRAADLISIEAVGAHVYRPQEKPRERSDNSFLDKLRQAGRRAVSSGARKIVLGSTTVIQEREPLEQQLGYPVIDPGSAALGMAIRATSAPAQTAGEYPRKVYDYGLVMAEKLNTGKSADIHSKTLTDLTLPLKGESVEKAWKGENMAVLGHLGTHFDIMNRRFPLGYTRRPGYVFDVSAWIDQEIPPEAVDPVLITEGHFIAFYSGFQQRFPYGTDDYFHNHPQLSRELIEYLLEKEIAIIGIDFAGIRRGSEHTPADQRCADRNVFVVENLCNLAKILENRSHRPFIAHTYPMAFPGMTGLPCRVVAETV